MLGNKIEDTGTGSQSAINTGTGTVNQSITYNTFYGIKTSPSGELQAQSEAAVTTGLSRIRLVDSVGPERPIISNQAFEDVEILGPCIIYVGSFKGVILDNCGWYGNAQSLFVEVSDEREYMLGVIGLDHCRFTRCIFKNVAIMAKTSAMPAIKQGFNLG